MANIFNMNEARYRQSSKDVGKYKGSLHYPQNSWTLVHKWLKIGPEFLPTLSILFRRQSIAQALSGINVASPHGESKWNAIGFVCMQL